MKASWIIVIVIVGSLLLRVIGIDYGLPHQLVGDEPSLLGGALKMAELKNPIPATNPEAFRILYYPPFLPWILLGLFAPFIAITHVLFGGLSFTAIRETLILDPSTLLLLARIFIAFVGAASVWLLYRFVSRVFGKTEGIIAAILLGTSFFHVSLSHFARHWVPATLFILLAFYFAWRILEEKMDSTSSPFNAYLWGALAIGLGFGVSYVVGFGIISLILAHFLRGKPFSQAIRQRPFWVMVIVIVILALLVFLLYPQEILRELSGAESPQGKSLIGYLESFRFYGGALLGLEPVLAILGAIGAFVLGKREPRFLWLILLFTFLYVSGLYFFFHHEPRYIILLTPMLALLGAVGLVALIKDHRWAYAVLAIPLVFVLQYDRLLTKPDSREVLAERILNLSQEKKVIGFLPGIRILPTKLAIQHLEKLDPSALRTLERTLKELPDSRYPGEARYVVNLAQVSSERWPRDFSQYDYFANAGWKPGDIDIHGSFTGPIWKVFSLERFGPTVEFQKRQAISDK